jgi:hypothetical protein
MRYGLTLEILFYEILGFRSLGAVSTTVESLNNFGI